MQDFPFWTRIILLQMVKQTSGITCLNKNMPWMQLNFNWPEYLHTTEFLKLFFSTLSSFFLLWLLSGLSYFYGVVYSSISTADRTSWSERHSSVLGMSLDSVQEEEKRRMVAKLEMSPTPCMTPLHFRVAFFVTDLVVLQAFFPCCYQILQSPPELLPVNNIHITVHSYRYCKTLQ